MRGHPLQYPPHKGMRHSTEAYRRTRCRAGLLPAECLLPRDRDQLVRDLWADGLTDVQIAEHTRMTTYTTGRIRARLGLAPHHARKEAAA